MDVSRHGLIEGFRGDSVQLSEIAVEHHAMTPNEEDSLFDVSGSHEDSPTGAGRHVSGHEKKPRVDLVAARHKISAFSSRSMRSCNIRCASPSHPIFAPSDSDFAVVVYSLVRPPILNVRRAFAGSIPSSV